MDSIQPGRRDLLLTPLLAALPMALASTASASPLNPAQTIIRLPAEHAWIPNKGYPERSVDMCPCWATRTRPECTTRWCAGGRAI